MKRLCSVLFGVGMAFIFALVGMMILIEAERFDVEPTVEEEPLSLARVDDDAALRGSSVLFDEDAINFETMHLGAAAPSPVGHIACRAHGSCVHHIYVTSETYGHDIGQRSRRCKFIQRRA